MPDYLLHPWSSGISIGTSDSGKPYLYNAGQILLPTRLLQDSDVIEILKRHSAGLPLSVRRDVAADFSVIAGFADPVALIRSLGERAEAHLNHVYVAGIRDFSWTGTGSPNYLGGEVFAKPYEKKPPAWPDEATQVDRLLVGVLDTGIATTTDTELMKHLDAMSTQAQNLDDPTSSDLPPMCGHGTFVAGVINMAAPEAEMAIRRVMSGTGVTDDVSVAQAVSQLLGSSVQILNCSFAGPTSDDRPPALLSAVMSAFTRDGRVVVAAAGNNATDRPMYPAALSDTNRRVIAVAALGAGDRLTEWSNRGKWVTASAQGDDVASSFYRFNGPQRADGGEDPDDFEGWAIGAGTSFAAPLVAGRIASEMLATDQSAFDAWQKVASANPRASDGVSGVHIK